MGGKKMERRKLLYEGKSKQVYTTDEADKAIILFKDDATAGDGAKKGTIKGKGEVNAKFTDIIFRMLEKQGIPTHLIKPISPIELLCQNVKIVPIELIVRNWVAGSLAKRLGKEEGTPLPRVVLEHGYKSDELHDPMINEWHILAFNFATEAQYKRMNEIALKVNEILVPFFDARNVILVDYKLEFGLTTKGELVLADEFTPDGARLWDKATKKKLDKDRFRRDLGGIEEAYAEILKRIE
jgi:phosphoribosylaminoimidazole-succinocarboxamide synthase